jgi:hypothetical protein
MNTARCQGRRKMISPPLLCPLDPVQHLVALIDPRPRLVLARETERVLQIADDAPVSELQLRRKGELGCHVRRNDCHLGVGSTAPR